ncbi:MAG: NADH-quinone oxidoreductase subunit N [Anaerolineae bacterium]
MGSFEFTLWQLSPELILLLMGGVLLGLDALRSYWDASRWTPYVALVGLLGAYISVVTLWGHDTRLFEVLACDGFALVAKALALLATGLVILIASEYIRMRRGRNNGAFYALLLLAALSICLVGAARDLLVVVLSFELFGIVSYIIIGYLRDDPRAGEAATKYFLSSAVASAMMLYGLSWFYGVAGSTDLATIASALSESGTALRPLLLSPLVLMVAGFAVKVALVPFHQWAPDVCEGTTAPVVALFTVAPALVGVAGFVRMLVTMFPIGLQVLDVDLGTLLSALLVFTMLVGNLVALWQRNVKRFLAYFSIAQIGYLLIGVVVHVGVAQAERPLTEVAAISERGIVAVLFSLAAYVVGDLGALAAVLALFEHTGSYEIDDYAGMHRRAPELAWPLLLCLLSLAGLPPLAGFIGKLYLFSAAVEGGLLWLAIVGVVNSVVSLACVWKIARVLFVAAPQAEGRLAVPPMLVVALGIAVTGVFALAVFANPILLLFQSAAEALVSAVP